METANFGSNISNLAQTTDKRAEPFGQTVSELAHDKKISPDASLDAAIVSTNLSLKTGDGDQSLNLVLKTAIEGINAELAPTLGANAIQTAVDNGIDVSPEATAERIVSLSTRMLTPIWISIPPSINSSMSFAAVLIRVLPRRGKYSMDCRYSTAISPAISTQPIS